MYTLLLKAFIFHQQGKIILKVIPTISFLCYNFSCVVDSAIFYISKDLIVITIVIIHGVIIYKIHYSRFMIKGQFVWRQRPGLNSTHSPSLHEKVIKQ